MDVVCVGECIVDLIPLGESVYKACFGGAPMNTAIACSRLGLKVGAITCIGNDRLGDFLLETLKANMIDVSRIRRLNLRTTISIVSKQRMGEVDYIFYRKPWSLSSDTEYYLSSEDVEYLRGARLLHTSGFAFSQKPARDEYQKLIREAKKIGLAISLDPTFRIDVWPNLAEAYEVYRELFHVADIVLSTYRELRILLGIDSIRGILDLCSKYGWRILGIKMGAKGSILYMDGATSSLESFKIKVADTVGAGDAWNAAIIYGIIKGLAIDEVILLANAVAAMKCMRVGAVEGLPTLEDVKRFIESRSDSRPKPLRLEELDLDPED